MSARGGVGRRFAWALLVSGASLAALALNLRTARSDEQGDADCAKFCEQAFPPGPLRGSCVSDAAHGSGACVECGPRTTTGQVLCGQTCCAIGAACCDGACASILSDDANCGACGNACSSDRICQGGACVCPPFTAECGGSCINILTDPDNCGGCGRVCPVACVRGTCV